MMKKLFHISIALLLMVGIGACDYRGSGDTGFRATDKEYMELLIKELDSAGVSYRIDSEGFVRYPPQEKARIEKIKARLDKIFYPFPDGWGTVNSTDPEYIGLLKKELESAGVKFVIGRKGGIEYSLEDKPRFEKVNSEVRRLLYGGVRIKSNDKSKRKDLISVLKKEGVEYTIQKKEDGIWVRWYPKDEKHEEEIWSKLERYACPKKRKEKSENKKASSQTTPSQMILKQGDTQSCAS